MQQRWPLSTTPGAATLPACTLGWAWWQAVSSPATWQKQLRCRATLASSWAARVPAWPCGTPSQASAELGYADSYTGRWLAHGWCAGNLATFCVHALSHLSHTRCALRATPRRLQLQLPRISLFCTPCVTRVDWVLSPNPFRLQLQLPRPRRLRLQVCGRRGAAAGQGQPLAGALLMIRMGVRLCAV